MTNIKLLPSFSNNTEKIITKIPINHVELNCPVTASLYLHTFGGL